MREKISNGSEKQAFAVCIGAVISELVMVISGVMMVTGMPMVASVAMTVVMAVVPAGRG